MPDIITVENVFFSYQGDSPKRTFALQDINLRIAAGEYLAIIGHNASGKSTLAKHFNALLRPLSGNVRVDNMLTKEDRNIYKIRQLVGMVFQNPDNQIVATTVEEDTAFGPENLGLPRQEIRERVEYSLKTVGLWDLRHYPPHLLSGGQKQRLAIAGVIAMNTRCVIFDEATSMLDPRGRREVMETIKKLNEQGITIIYITHFMEEVKAARRIVVMAGGRIVLEGSPGEIFSLGEELEQYGLKAPAVTVLAQRL
ncbi:MAG TPA: energy-coupling factor transporter ATPase, partial [Firmicutes bacterium]|nr:energy-coupling factor transporter ATPase [Bacillota bacterium]